MRRANMTLTDPLDPRTEAAFKRKDAPVHLAYVTVHGKARTLTGPEAERRRAEIQREKQI